MILSAYTEALCEKPYQEFIPGFTIKMLWGVSLILSQQGHMLASRLKIHFILASRGILNILIMLSILDKHVFCK